MEVCLRKTDARPMEVAILAVLLCSQFIKANSQNVTAEAQCFNDEQGTLENRVKDADVVLTGTVRYIVSRGEDAGSAVAELSESHRQTTGFVQVWSVLKGSIQYVTNYSHTSNESMVPEGIGNFVVKMYGLRNDHVCGSYLRSNETKIFFLAYLRDFRPNVDVLSQGTEEANSVLFKSLASIPSGNAKKEGETGKKKKRHNKKSRKKVHKRKKGRGKRRSKRQRKFLTTPSEFLTSHTVEKRSPDNQSDDQKPNKYPFKVLNDAGGERRVLIIKSSPARISLQNLNDVEGLVEMESKMN